MKRLICILLSCLLLFVSGAFAETATEPKETVHQIETKAYPFYMGSKEDKWPEDFPLYFLDGVYDLPYVDLNDWARVLNKLYSPNGCPDVQRLSGERRGQAGVRPGDLHT